MAPGTRGRVVVLAGRLEGLADARDDLDPAGRVDARRASAARRVRLAVVEALVADSASARSSRTCTSRPVELDVFLEVGGSLGRRRSCRARGRPGREELLPPGLVGGPGQRPLVGVGGPCRLAALPVEVAQRSGQDRVAGAQARPPSRRWRAPPSAGPRPAGGGPGPGGPRSRSDWAATSLWVLGDELADER